MLHPVSAQQQQQQQQQEPDPGLEDEKVQVDQLENPERGYDVYAEAYAEAMRQWGEYGTGPYPSDDGTGWLGVSPATLLLVLSSL